MTKCERCKKVLDPTSFRIMDYCAACSRNLCAECMAKGCCGKVPAESGEAVDNEDDS